MLKVYTQPLFHYPLWTQAARWGELISVCVCDQICFKYRIILIIIFISIAQLSIISHYKRMGYAIILKPNVWSCECVNSRCRRFDLLLFNLSHWWPHLSLFWLVADHQLSLPAWVKYYFQIFQTHHQIFTDFVKLASTYAGKRIPSNKIINVLQPKHYVIVSNDEDIY